MILTIIIVFLSFILFANIVHACIGIPGLSKSYQEIEAHAIEAMTSMEIESKIKELEDNITDASLLADKGLQSGMRGHDLAKNADTRARGALTDISLMKDKIALLRKQYTGTRETVKDIKEKVDRLVKAKQQEINENAKEIPGVPQVEVE